MDFYFLLVITHLVGAVLGVGGATFIEINLVRALRDGKMDPMELEYFKMSVKVTRIGTLVSIISGLGFFLLSTRYLDNPIFWAKMTVFAIILVNAYLLEKHKVPLWLGSPLSFVSWYFVLLFGEMSSGSASFTLSYMEAILYYAVALLIGGVILDAIRKKFTNKPSEATPPPPQPPQNQ